MRFLEPFKGNAVSPPPVWLMRQAGRYLPEYRAVRNKAGGFLDLCYNPALATEVTLQPIRRFGFDAAILFSDILVVPHALGQKLDFVEGEGPRLDPITTVAQLARLDPSQAIGRLSPVFETVARLRQDLPTQTALIGFCGAPWTVATYMVEGEGSKDQQAARLWAYRDRDGFERLIEMLVETSIDYLDGQVRAGANVLQIFDSWSGSLAEGEFERWVIKPTLAITKRVKERHPAIPIIGFPRGAGYMTGRYRDETGVDGIGCDTSMPLNAMRQLQDWNTINDLPRKIKVVQGNLDPLLLVAGGAALEDDVRLLVDKLGDLPFIFNLGHGIVPQTPPENVARLVELVREAR